MPEGLEAEIWCRSAQPLVGRTVASMWYDERVAPDGLSHRLIGAEIRAVRRAGKVLVVDTDGPITVPVGEKTLGRIMNVVGEPVDQFLGSRPALG